MDTRREFIKKAGLLAGGAGLWSSLPASIQRALSINPDPGTTFEDAEHVVFLMQENRSFDHCFGTLQGVRGYNDPRRILLPDQLPVWFQTNPQGKTYPPFRLNIKDTNATWIGGLPHSWPDQVDARNHGKYDKWLVAKPFGTAITRGFPMTMGHYIREDLPFYYALADAFTVCDQNFCASLTGTTPNRSFFWTGKIRDKPGSKADVRNSDLYYNKEASWKTFPERLEENNISWKVYQNEISVQSELQGEEDSLLSNFTDNNLEWFTQYHVRFHKAHTDFLKKRTAELPAEIERLEEQQKKAKQNTAVKIGKVLKQKKEQLEKYKQELITWSPENFEKLSSFEKSIHQRAFTTNVNDQDYHEISLFEYEENGEKRGINMPKGDILHQFRQDVNDGKLPAVSWLVAPQYFSDHPSAPWFGAWYVSEVLDILTKNPEVWKKTIFVLNYDENDGYFDHVPPFVAPRPNDFESGKVSDGIDTFEEYVTMKEEKERGNLKQHEMRESPVGLGYRVPLVIASPWSRGGWVNSQVFDISSTLRFLETFLSKKTGKNIRESNISDWRRTITGDLTSVFRPYNGEKIELPEFVKRDPFVEKIYNAKFKNLPSDFTELSSSEIHQLKSGKNLPGLLPVQEKGIRNSCALPYEIAVNEKLIADKGIIEITFSAGNKLFGKNSAGVPFTIYAHGKYISGGHSENGKVWNYAVAAGSELKGEWPVKNFENHTYHLTIYGPNGFFRELKGKQNDPDIVVNMDPEKNNSNKITGNIVLTFKNQGEKRYELEIDDSVYKRGSKKIILDKGAIVSEIINLKESYYWYDFTIKSAENAVFVKRFAGRIETGLPTKTDPVMGQMI